MLAAAEYNLGNQTDDASCFVVDEWTAHEEDEETAEVVVGK